MKRSFLENKNQYTFINIIFLLGTIFLYHTGILSEHSVIVTILGLGVLIFFSIREPFLIAMLFIGSLPLENIFLTPVDSPIELRPYQLLGIAALGGAIYHHVRTKLFVIQMRWSVLDLVVGLLAIISVILLGWSDQTMTSLQQTVILISFTVLYGVVRIFVQENKEVIALVPIMISSGVVVSGYAILQNMIYYVGGRHLEVMPGRPNATFAEPDWLGAYLVFVCAVCLAYLFYNVYHKHVWRFFDAGLFGAMTITLIALILSAARSAWLGAGCVFVVYLLVIIIQKRYKMFTRHVLWIGASFGIALMIVVGGHLTSFSLGDRLNSTQSGKQEITVACENAENAEVLIHKQVIDSIGQLAAYGCRHINVEDISYENSQGNSIITIYRDDPNVVVRKLIYRKTIVAIMEQPWTGYGWGASSKFLGFDERGTPLNASNVLLETAVSIGLLGLAALCVIFLITGVRALYIFANGKNMVAKSVALLCGLYVVAILVPQMFNAGLFQGYVWVCFGFFAILWEDV